MEVQIKQKTPTVVKSVEMANGDSRMKVVEISTVTFNWPCNLVVEFHIALLTNSILNVENSHLLWSQFANSIFNAFESLTELSVGII